MHLSDATFRLRGDIVNIVIISGRLTGNPDIKVVSNNTKIARYILAVDRIYSKKDKKADFIHCVAFGKNADIAEKYLSKGSRVTIRGHWQTGDYTDKSGEKRYTNDCIVESHEFENIKEMQHQKTQEPMPEPIPQPEPNFMDVPDLSSMEDEFPFS